MRLSKNVVVPSVAAGLALLCALPLLARAADPWAPADLVQPADFAREIHSGTARPAVVFVGFRALFRPGHIPGAVMEGPASTAEGLAELRKWAEPLPRSMPVVIYCGCCPLVHCPNVRPAFAALRAMGFTSVRVVVLEKSFGDDWVDKGYPVERQ
jgi:thiosulfate/3-mercaptopyruvate sulfurtransferase